MQNIANPNSLFGSGGSVGSLLLLLSPRAMMMTKARSRLGLRRLSASVWREEGEVASDEGLAAGTVGQAPEMEPAVTRE